MEKTIVKNSVDSTMNDKMEFIAYNGDPAIMHIEATPVTSEVAELLDLLKEAVYLLEQAKFKFAKGTTNSNADMFLRKESIKPYRAMKFESDAIENDIVYMD